MFEQNAHESDDIEIEAVGVEISSQPVELYKILKIADAVSGGGEAKYAISEGFVAVNGEIELRKRRKMYDGDLIEFNQEFYLVICDAAADESPEDHAEPQAKPVSNQSASSANGANTPSSADKTQASAKNKRRNLDFLG